LLLSFPLLLGAGAPLCPESEAADWLLEPECWSPLGFG
jgi:hypothetical protein